MEQTMEKKIIGILQSFESEVDYNGIDFRDVAEALATFFKQELEEERRKAFEAGKSGYLDGYKVKIWTSTFPDYESYLASL